jgi:uncharacterized protein YuzE
MEDISKKFASYDTKKDSLYIAVRGGIKDDVVELVPCVNLEVNNAGEMIGIEILNVSRLFRDSDNSRTKKGKPRKRTKPSSKKRKSGLK